MATQCQTRTVLPVRRVVPEARLLVGSQPAAPRYVSSSMAARSGAPPNVVQYAQRLTTQRSSSNLSDLCQSREHASPLLRTRGTIPRVDPDELAPPVLVEHNRDGSDYRPGPDAGRQTGRLSPSQRSPRLSASQSIQPPLLATLSMQPVAVGARSVQMPTARRADSMSRRAAVQGSGNTGPVLLSTSMQPPVVRVKQPTLDGSLLIRLPNSARERRVVTSIGPRECTRRLSSQMQQLNKPAGSPEVEARQVFQPGLKPSVNTDELAAIGVTYVSPEELAKEISAGSDSKPKLAVIDLRSFDYAGGNVRGSVHVPHNQIVDPNELDVVIARFASCENVVFHCMLSMHRAPYCARLYKKRLMELGIQQQVRILKGGFGAWRTRYTGNEALIENESEDEQFAQYQLELGRLFGQEAINSL